MAIDLLWGDLMPGWVKESSSRGLRIEAVPPTESVIAAFDPARLRPALDAFVRRRLRLGVAGQVMMLSWRSAAPTFVLVWEESVARRSRRRADRGSLEAGVFALPYLARVVAAHGGVVTRDATGPFRVRICWPLELGSHE
jgi:hypothetical protein